MICGDLDEVLTMGSGGGRFWRDMEIFEQVCLRVKLCLRRAPWQSVRDKLKEKQPLEGRQTSIFFGTK